MDYVDKHPHIIEPTPGSGSSFPVNDAIRAQPARPVAHFDGRMVSGPWSTGLCNCFSDVSNCCITWWCPCITFGQIADILDRGSSSCGMDGALYALIGLLTGCSCIYSCFYRSKIRAQYMLPERPCGDCLVHFCCEPCALCQEYRELKNRGFDMSLGWHGNIMKRNPEVAMTSPIVGGMDR